MQRSSEIPEYAASALGRAKPTVLAIFVTGLVAGAVALAVFAGASSDTASDANAKRPAVQYEPILCEPDGTFCEPTYLSPPPERPVPAGSGLLTSQRETPSG